MQSNAVTSTPEKKVRLDVAGLKEDEAAFMDFINENMVGQPRAKQAALRVYRAIQNPLRDPNRPIFSMILAGESRSGKNHLVRLLAQWFHQDQKALVKVNGGEFQEKYALSRLIGAPHGYIGHNDANDPGKKPQEGKKDTSAILSQHNLNHSNRGSSNDVVFVLLDEWEKMHQNVINILLAGLDEGESTLANNEDVDFRNVVFIMTSNMGMADLEKSMTSIGFMNDRETGRVASFEEVEAAVKKAFKNTSSPEFRNRIDLLVVFEKLDSGQLFSIVNLEFKYLQKRVIDLMPHRLFMIRATDEAKQYLLDLATSSEEGGLANLKRIMNEHILEPVGSLARHGLVQTGDVVEIGLIDSAIVFDKVEGAADLNVFKAIPIIGQNETVDLSNGITAYQSAPVADASTIVSQHAQGLPFAMSISTGSLLSLSELMFLQRAHELKTLAGNHSPLMATYEVKISSDKSLDVLTQAAFLVVRDLTDILGVKVLASETTYEPPYEVSLKVRALPGQIELLRLRFSGVRIRLVDGE